MMTPAKLLTLACLLASSLSVLGCSEKAAPEAQRITGAWVLDKAEFARVGTKAMVDARKIPQAASRATQEILARVEMQLELDASGSFSCTMGNQGELREYTGTWQRDGDALRLDQTHEQGELKADSMVGRIEAGKLRLRHAEQGMQMPYILRRPPTAKPGR